MAYRLGKNYRLYLESETPGTFNDILGQQDLTIDRSVSQIDLSTKDSGVYGLSAPGQRSVSITGTIQPDLPDATGYTRFETIANDAATPTVGIQVRKAPFADTDVVFEADMYPAITSTSFPTNGGVTAGISLTLASAPVKDTLA